MSRMIRESSLSRLVVIMIICTMLAACGASQDCCDCVENHGCKGHDEGACNSDDPCADLHSNDDSYDDDEDGVVAFIMGTMAIFCMIFNPRHMSVSSDCAERYGCKRACGDDERFINYY